MDLLKVLIDLERRSKLFEIAGTLLYDDFFAMKGKLECLMLTKSRLGLITRKT